MQAVNSLMYILIFKSDTKKNSKNQWLELHQTKNFCTVKEAINKMKKIYCSSMKIKIYIYITYSIQYIYSTNKLNKIFNTYQFSSAAQSCLHLCDPMDCSTPGLLVHHQLLKLTQTHVCWVGYDIQPSHPLSSPSSPVLNLSQHQGLIKWVSLSH